MSYQDSLPYKNITWLKSSIFMGDRIGAIQADNELYDNGSLCFEILVKTRAFMDACGEIRNYLEYGNTCLLCAEKDPIACHRALVITDYFRRNYASINIVHILADPIRYETMEKFNQRVMDKYYGGQYPLFPGGDAVEELDRAYAGLSRKMACRKK